MHLINPRGTALTACNLAAARRDELTVELDERTCEDCRRALIAQGVCPVCGEKQLTWSCAPHVRNGIADGRLTTRDVQTIFYLGCDGCSETIIPLVDPEVVVAALNAATWRP